MINTAKLLNRCTVVASLAMLAACGGGGGGGSPPPPPPTGTNDTIVATPSPTGVISVAVGSSAAFSVTFTTDDGKTATNLSITSGLSALPAGWSGPTSFSCASVSTGSGCMVNLTYKPTAVVSSSVTFNYSYVNNAGTSKTGMATVSYTATSNNNVVAKHSPAGQIAVITGGKSPVSITFTTDDGQPATKLSITAGLSPLPAGWSGPGTFTCASVSTGSGCVLNLNYAPSTIASSTLQLNYSYNADSGTAKTGSVMIPYTATTHNNLVEAQSPGGSISAVVNSGSVPVKLTFTTDDGNPATAITITSGLSTLAAAFPGWSGPATFSCASASTGTGCQLALKYMPTVNGSGTVALGYSYNDDSGTAKTGTAKIAYASIPGFLYITDVSSNVIRCAVSGVDGGLSSCASAASGFKAPTGIAFSGNWAYVTPGALATTDVDVCAVGSDGTLGACKRAQTFGSPSALAVSGGQLYVADANGPGGNAYSCPINNADGSLPACTTTPVGAAVSTLDGIAVTGTNAYLVDINGGNVSTCAVSPTDGSLSACTQQTLNNTAPGGGNTPPLKPAAPRSASVYGGTLYIGTTAGPMLLTIAGDGTVTPVVGSPFCSLAPVITSCTIDGVATSPTQTPLNGLAFNNGYAYVSGVGNGGGIGICTIEASGILDKCVTSPDLLVAVPAIFGGLAVH
jgi:hypothetical protein